MEKLSYFNELIINTNQHRVEFEKTIRYLKDSELFSVNFENPINLVQNALYKLKEQGEKSGFDIFGEDSYLKFIYVAFLEATIVEMSNCLHNCITYVNSNIISKLTHKRLMDESLEAFSDYYLLLKIFDSQYVMEYYQMMLETDGYFESFKPGMFYKYTVFLMGEIKEYGLEIENNYAYVLVMNKVRELEKELENNKQSVDYDNYDNLIEGLSSKYHVDFVSLDKDYSYEVRDMDDEKDQGNSRQRK